MLTHNVHFEKRCLVSWASALQLFGTLPDHADCLKFKSLEVLFVERLARWSPLFPTNPLVSLVNLGTIQLNSVYPQALPVLAVLRIDPLTIVVTAMSARVPRNIDSNRRATALNCSVSRLALDSASQITSVFLSKSTVHPNVFRNRIKRIEGKVNPGDWVAVYSLDADTGSTQLVGYGLYNPKSEIALRIIRWGEILPDNHYWDALIDRAVQMRRDQLALDKVTDCYRVIHGEADGVPGIVVDRYGDTLSAEVFSHSMDQRAEEIIQRLASKIATRHWLIQPSPQFTSQEGFTAQSRASTDLPTQVIVQEHGTRFRIHFDSGHKTGFFCDQRENRFRLAEFCRGKNVLDVCCYTGGFSVQAARLGGAAEVTGIDLDEQPLRIAKQNAAINNVKVRFVQAEAFGYMRDMLRQGKRYDVVVLDPPKLIRNRAEIEEGTRKHFDLNRLAMQLVNPGGLLLTCSCAGLLEANDFERLVRSAARSAIAAQDAQSAPRVVQTLLRTGAASCHPVSVNCPETEYLKAIWLRM